MSVATGELLAPSSVRSRRSRARKRENGIEHLGLQVEAELKAKLEKAASSLGMDPKRFAVMILREHVRAVQLDQSAAPEQRAA